MKRKQPDWESSIKRDLLVSDRESLIYDLRAQGLTWNEVGRHIPTSTINGIENGITGNRARQILQRAANRQENKNG